MPIEFQVYSLLRLGNLPLKASADFGPGVDTVFKLQMGDMALGDVLRYLVNLAAPGMDFELTPPWDVLNEINLRDLTLDLDVTQGRVGFVYDGLGVDLTFLKLSKLEVWYGRSAGGGGRKSVDLSLFGTLLGKDFTQTPITWDLLNQPAPAAPGTGAGTFDLEYLGLGQHVTLRQLPGTVTGVIQALEDASRPVDPGKNPLSSLPGLKFDASSGWLAGTRFSVLGAVSLSAVFNDPNLYGLLVGLSGPRVGSLAGLQFEILYRKVSPTLGLYSIQLKLPDAVRTIDVGEASITLPIIDLDVYTNGNFLVNLGFPHGLDFSNSFTFQVIVYIPVPVPVVGAGGLYFGVLDSQTSTAVPTITNGTFSPVIVAGIGMQIGVGKSFSMGPLSAGILVAVEGILEGVLGFFQPSQPGVARETYYRVSGTIAITGHLYGKIDFVIVQASVDVYAYASAQLIVEAHQAALVTLSAGVSVSVRVKILFIHISFSFSANINTSFTLGHPTQAPWILASGTGGAPQLAAGVGYRRVHPALLLMDDVFSAVSRRGLAWEVAQREDAAAELPVLTLYFLPQVTVGLASDFPSSGAAETPRVQLTGLLAIDCGAPGGTSGALSSFEQIARAALLWAVQTIHAAKVEAGGVADGTTVTLSELRFVFDDLTQPNPPVPITFPLVTQFFAQSFQFRVGPPPAEGTTQSYTLFPMLPYLELSTSDGAFSVDFATASPCTPAYQQLILEYFQQLAAQAAAHTANASTRAAAGNTVQADSMAALMFTDTFTMVLRQVVQSALDLLGSYPYTAQAGDTLASIAARYGLTAPDAVAVIAQANQGSGTLLPPTDAWAQQPNQIILGTVDTQVRQAESLGALGTRMGLSLPQVAAALADGPGVLAPGATLAVTGGTYVARAGDTAASVAAHFFLPVTAVPEIISGNPQVTDWNDLAGQTLSLPTLTYTLRQNDTLRSVAAYFGVALDALAAAAPNSTSPTLLAPLAALSFSPTPYTVRSGDTLASIAADFGGVPALGQLNASVTGLLAAGAKLTVPGSTYEVQPGDTLAGVAAHFSTSARALAQANGTAPGLLSPGAAITLPGLVHTVQAGDALLDIAAGYDLTVAELAELTVSSATWLGTVVVPEAEQIPADELTSRLAEAGSLNAASGMVARFLMNGLRLPDPAKYAGGGTPDWTEVSLYPLYNLTGQQWAAPASPTPSYGITLAPSTHVPEGITPPAITFDSTTAGELEVTLAPDTVARITAFAGLLANTPIFDPGILSLTRFPPYTAVPKRYALGKAVAWQAPTPPAFVQDPPAQAAGNPRLYTLPTGLRAQIAAQAPGLPALQVMLDTPPAPSGEPSPPTPLANFGWATRLDFEIRQAPDPTRPGEFLPSVYEVLSTSASGLQDLQALVGYLHGAGSGDAVEIDLLYAANPTGRNGSGLRSDVPAASTVLLKANLSTLTHSPSQLQARGVLLLAAQGAPDVLADAPLSDPVAFLTLLWECGVVNSGGYYLFYRTAGSGGGQGLPDALFNQAPTAVLTVLATVRAAQQRATLAPAAFHNALVLAQNLPAADSSVFVTGPTYPVGTGDTLAGIAAALGVPARALGEANATTPNLLQPGTPLAVGGGSYTVQVGDDVLDVALTTGAAVDAVVDALSGLAGALTPGAVIQVDPAWVVLRSTLAPGSAGFRLLRTDPDPDASNAAVADAELGAQSDAATALQVLYNLVGYWLTGEGGFVPSPEGLPTGPTTDRNQAPNGALRATAAGTPPWSYQRVLSIAQYAAQQPPAGPVAGQDPYAGLGTSAQLGLQYYDLYGNQCLPAGTVGPLDVEILYRDPIFGLAQWPGLTAAFGFAGDGAAPTLQVVLGFDPTRYVAPAGATLASVLQRAQGDQARYREIYFQFSQADVRLAVETTLDQEASHPLDTGTLLGMATAAYRYLGSLQALQGVTATVGQEDTLESIAATYRVTPDLVARANQGSGGILQPGATLSVPVLYVALQNDTPELVAERYPSLTLPELASGNPDAPLQPGTQVAFGTLSTVKGGDTLASIAAAQGVPVAAIGGANASTLGLLAAGAILYLPGGIGAYTVQAGDTLQSIAARFVTPVQSLAAIDASLPGLFPPNAVVSAGGQHYTVTPTDTLATVATQLGLDLSALAAAVATDPGILQAGVQVTTPTMPWTVRPGDTLGSIADAQGLTAETVSEQAASTAGLLQEGASVLLPRTVKTGSTLQSIAAAQQVSVWDVGESAAAVPGLLVPEARIPLASGGSYPVKRGDTLAGIAASLGVSVAEVSTDAATVTGLLQPETVVPLYLYTVQPGDTLSGAATKLEVDPGALMEANADVASFFAAGATLYLGSRAHSVSAGDTLAGIAAAGNVSVAQLAARNAGDAGVLARGAGVAVPGHVALGPGAESLYTVQEGNTLASIASGNAVTVEALAAANQALDGMLAVGARMTLPALQPVTVQSGDTLATVLLRLQQQEGGSDATVAELATANQGLPGLLAVEARILLPPAQQSWSVPITPAYPGVIFPVAARVAITRSAALVDPAFTSVPGVQSTRSELRPPLQEDAADGGSALGLQAFAASFETAFPHLKLATGGGGTSGKRLLAVQLGTGQLGYSIRPTPYFFAPKPLSRLPWSTGSSPVPIQDYANGSLAGSPRATHFTGIDLDTWGSGFLAAVDRFLSPEYAVPAYQLAPDAYRGVLAAKDTLARAIRAQVAQVLVMPYTVKTGDTLASIAAAAKVSLAVLGETNADVAGLLAPGDTVSAGGTTYTVLAGDTLNTIAASLGATVDAVAAAASGAALQANTTLGLPGESDPESARETLYQQLLVTLSSAYTVDTIVQFRVDTTSPFQDPETAPRLAMKTVGESYAIPTGATLASVAAHFGVPVALLATVAADYPFILVQGAEVSYGGKSYTVQRTDTLRTVAQALDAGVGPLAEAVAEQAGLLQPGAGLNLVVQTYTTTADDTFRTLLDYFVPGGVDGTADSAPLDDFVTLNGELPGLLAGGGTLNGAAAAKGVPAWQLVEDEMDEPGVIAGGATVRFLALLPGFSLSDARVALVDEAGTGDLSSLSFLFRTASATEFSHVSLELGFEINELEYDIRDVPWADGYQASEWLSLVIPVTDSSVGSVDIPVPLRAYPSPPSVLSQTTQQQPGGNPSLQQIETYEFVYSYEYQRAAQDQLFTAYSTDLWNGTGTAALFAPASSLLPAALAQYQVVAVPLGQDLAALPFVMLPGNQGLRTVATAAVETFAQLAQRVAEGWEGWTTPPTGRQPEYLYRVREQRTRRNERRVTMVPASRAARAAEAAPLVSLSGHQPAGPARGGAVRTFTFLAGANDGPVPRDVFTHQVPDLSVLRAQNVWGSVQVTRNADLVADQQGSRWATSTDFIYQVGPVGYPSPAVPLLTYSDPFPMASVPAFGETGSSPLATRLIDFFGALLQLTPTSAASAGRNLRVAVSYGFFLAGTDPDNAMVTRVPVTMVPNFLFDPTRDLTGPAGFCNQLAAALTTWLSNSEPPRQGGMWVFDLSLYTTPPAGAGDTTQLPPLLEMSNVQLPLTEVAGG